ncbi:hypothetical protein [Corallococcus exercitus]|uniref:hypothetical protein n=1 Tax=Corallococcus exercitus TaxID=2316736 RepID=UPI0035D40CBE
MANITVDLSTNPISYSPGPEVKHGDTVTFSMGSYPSSYTATVTFPDGNCLTTSVPYPYTLGGSPLTASTSPLTVSMTAAKGVYDFNAVIDDGTRDRGTAPRGPEERDRKNGGIDVTSEPPEDPAVR